MFDENDYKKHYSLYAKYITFKQYKKICKYKKILITIDNDLDALKRTLKNIKNIMTNSTLIELENLIELQYNKYIFWKNEYKNYLKTNNLFIIELGKYSDKYIINKCIIDDKYTCDEISEFLHI